MPQLRYAWRRLARRPTGTLLVIASLGLAIGGAGALLSVFNALVLRPMRVPGADRLVGVYPANGNALYGVPFATLAELARRQTVFDGICGITRGALQVDLGGTLSSHTAEAVTGSCYALTGLQPFMGRLIDEHDAPIGAGSTSVVVLSYRFWATSLARDSNIVGRTLVFNRVPLTVIGVTPVGVGGFDTDQAPDFVVPLGIFGRLLNVPVDGASHAIGRLRQGATLARAAAEMRTIWPDVWAATNPLTPGQSPSRGGTAAALRVESMARGLSRMRDQYGEPVLFLLLLAALLVTLACVNVGGLLLARAAARARELAVLTALGAHRGRLLTDVGLEGLLVGLGAGAVALPVAWITSGLFARLTWTGTLPTSLQTTPDLWVYAAIAVATVLTGIGISLPAVAYVRLTRPSLIGSARTVTGTASAWRRALIVGQVSVSTILVFAAGLFARNLASLRDLDPGYAPAHFVYTRLNLPLGQPRIPASGAYFQPMLEQIAALPGVSGVALSNAFPTTQLYQVVGLVPFRRVEAEPGIGDVGGTTDAVSPGFFRTLGVALDAGREFDWSDTPDHPAVAVINRSLASRLFPKHDPLGARVHVNARVDATIVGVVSDVSTGDYRLRDLPVVYLPLFQDARVFSPCVVIRTASGGLPTADIKAVIESAGRFQVPWFRTIEEQMNLYWLREQALASVALAFGAISLLIGALGLYALLDQSVGARQRELGVRMALGASRGQLLRMVARDGVLLALIGAALGVPLALIVGHAARALLSGISSYDGPSLQIALLALAAAVVLATVRPALRAASTRPSDALRAE